MYELSVRWQKACRTFCTTVFFSPCFDHVDNLENMYQIHESNMIQQCACVRIPVSTHCYLHNTHLFAYAFSNKYRSNSLLHTHTQTHSSSLQLTQGIHFTALLKLLQYLMLMSSICYLKCFYVPYRLKVDIKNRIFGNMIVKVNMGLLYCSSQQNTSLFHLMTLLIVVSDQMSSFIPVCVLWEFNKGDGLIKKKAFFSHYNDTLIKLYSLSLHNINVLVISSCLTFSSIFRQQYRQLIRIYNCNNL